MKPITDLLNIFYPSECLCCSNVLTNNELDICIHCRHELPLTNFSSEKDNLLERTFKGRIPLQNGTALFYFLKKGIVQELIHKLKYKDQQQIGNLIGIWLGDEIMKSGRFQQIDCIIPVPLHQKRQQQRGYNQVSEFGKALSKKLKIPFYENALIRIAASNTQTDKLRMDRWENVEKIFQVKNEKMLEGCHILLIDDVLTTGATLEACYNALYKIDHFKISIACMAYTK